MMGSMPDMTVEILTDCGNFMLEALNFSLEHFLKLKHFGTFTYITQIIHSNASLNLFKGIFSNKPLIIAEI